MPTDPDVLPLLTPGERVLALETCQSAFAGRADWTAPPPPRPRRSPLGCLVGGIATFFTGGWSPRWATGAFDALLGGTAARGAEGSTGWTMQQAMRSSASFSLLVTDRRLAVLERSSAGVVDDGRGYNTTGVARRRFSNTYRPVLELPPTAVAGARAARWPGQWGRIALVFTDGSVLTLVLGVISTRAARRVLAALPPVDH